MNWRRETGRDFSLYSKTTPDNIGPGTYDIEFPDVIKSSRRVAFGSGLERQTYSEKREETPDPGVYSASYIDSRIGYSSGFKSNSERKIFEIPNNPSPADYGKLEDWSVKRKNTIVKTEKLRPDSPMVGQDILGYEYKEDGKLRPVKKQFNGPSYIGPGSYTPRYDNKYSTRYHSMKEPFRDILQLTNSDTPGPGSYNPMSLTSARKSKISSRYAHWKINESLSGDIGPQEWVPAGRKRPTSSFQSQSARDIFADKRGNPSPDLYQRYTDPVRRPESQIHTGFGQRSDRFRSLKSDAPGPGSYEAKPVKWLSGSGKINNKGNFKSFNAANNYPGPGSYNLDNTWGPHDNKPSSAFATSRRTVHKDSTPGPGSYNIGGTLGKKGGTEILGNSLDHGSFLRSAQMSNPSPDSYQDVRLLLNKGVTISKLDRFKETINNTPGPGSYNVGASSLIKKSYNVDYYKK